MDQKGMDKRKKCQKFSEKGKTLPCLEDRTHKTRVKLFSVFNMLNYLWTKGMNLATILLKRLQIFFKKDNMHCSFLPREQ